MAEPKEDIAPLRIGTDGREAQAKTLGEIRDRMSPLTRLLIDVSAERYALTQDAVFFKASLDEVEAVEQQARNLDSALEYADLIRPGDVGFQNVIRAMMQAVITTSVEEQKRAFVATQPIC